MKICFICKLLQCCCVSCEECHKRTCHCCDNCFSPVCECITCTICKLVTAFCKCEKCTICGVSLYGWKEEDTAMLADCVSGASCGHILHKQCLQQWAGPATIRMTLLTDPDVIDPCCAQKFNGPPGTIYQIPCKQVYIMCPVCRQRYCRIVDNDYRKNPFLPACREQFEKKVQTADVQTSTVEIPPAIPSTSKQRRTEMKSQSQYTCKICGIVFDYRGTLTKHMQKFHSNGFPCPFENCDYRGPTQDQLKKHSKTHERKSD